VRGWKLALIAAGSLAGLLLMVATGAFFALRSNWFLEKVRERIVNAAETATGGRVELGSFSFDLRRLRAEVHNFVIHGAEPAGRPPLFRAASAAIGFRIVSLWKHQADIEYLNVTGPQVYLIFYPDGRANIPQPKLKPNPQPNAIENILDLAVGRFHLENGVLEIESYGKTRFDARGQSLSAKFLYEAAGTRYRANISIQPLDLRWGDRSPIPFEVNATLAIEPNRVEIASAKLAMEDGAITLSGSVRDFASPQISLRYGLRASLGAAQRVLKLNTAARGAVEVDGEILWRGGSDYRVTGKLHVYDASYRSGSGGLRQLRADGNLAIDPKRIAVTAMRFSGAAFNELAALRQPAAIPMAGQLASMILDRRDLDVTGIVLDTLGGTFTGDARIRDLQRFDVQGEIAGFEARRLVNVYSSEPLPWDALISGSIRLEGAFDRKNDLRARGALAIDPGPSGAAVHGQIALNYDAGKGVLDLGRSSLTLPSTRVDFSGAFGRELRVHLETRNLEELLPALGEDAAEFPVKLENGAAIFDGTIAGGTDRPQIAGHAMVTRFSYSGERFDSLEAEARASSNGINVQSASLSRGALSAQFKLTAELFEWKLHPDCAIAATARVRNAQMAELAAIVGRQIHGLTGVINADARISGTAGRPQVRASLEASRGGFDGEPFDRITAEVSSSERIIEVARAQVVAGAKRLELRASFDHPPGKLDTGRLDFEIESNAIALDQIQTLRQAQPDVNGAVQVTAAGRMDIAFPGPDNPAFRLLELKAKVDGHGLQMGGQPLGNASFTAETEGQVLHTRLSSDFADSILRGEGQWRLDGDYPGSATISFSKLSFEQLQAWISPSKSPGQARLIGAAEGELSIDGPALKPALMKATLRISRLQIEPALKTEFAANRAALTLANAEPVVLTMANSAISVESAHLKGRATDLAVTGKISLQPRRSLDLRIYGRADLALIQDLSPDLRGNGVASADTAVRGPLSAPRIDGRLEFQNAAFNLADLPNGISSANGVILFTGDRANIQELSGEIGGGKVRLSGFAGFGNNQLVFGLRAAAQQVRFRASEGVSTVANADLSLSGSSDRSMLSGTVAIVRTGFNPQSDLSSLLAASAQPVQTPSAQTGFLGGLNFDVQIQTSPNTEVESSLAQGLQMDTNLRLRGTASNPALLGRINITQGQIAFFGAKYTVSQGTISFYNPVKIEPIVDVDLDTKARGVQVTLKISGPLDKLNLSSRSDPPLQFSEIVALLATGRAPSSDPSLLAQQNTAPQSLQQDAASALLGQALNPTSGRLQRFFGVGNLRIDPTGAGVASNPLARLSLEQQVTPEITLTYITNVTSTNPQVVQVEWAFSKRWSVVALREENGATGLDFLYRRRFK
jgi:translocation and assembly module TamB